MSTDVCDRFQQHTWRKDTCANCLKPRKQHGPSPNPQPAKRLSRPPAAVRETSSLPDTQASDDASPEDLMENNPVRSRRGSGCPDAKRLSVVSSPKPAPIKSKPQLNSKPEKAKKPGTTAVDASGEKTGPGRKMADESGVKDDVRTVTGEDHGDVESDREPANAALRATKARPRPQVTPPQVPDSGKIPNAVKSTNKADAKTSVKPKPSSNAIDAPDPSTAKLSSDPKEKSSSASHYYQIYDISAKGLSGTPEPVDASDQNGVLSDSGKRTDSRGVRTGVCRVVDLIDEPQNVAMPYTVVDVTVCQPSKDQLVGKAPPQLPLTPAPIRDGGSSSSSTQNNTLPTNRTWSMREGSDPLRHTTPKAGHPSNDPCPESLSATRGAAVLPLDGKFLVGKMVNQDLYEDIAGCNDTNRNSSSGNSDVNATQSGSVGKSAALEAKMAALSKLDLSRVIATQGASTLPARVDDTKQEISIDRQDLGEMGDGRVGEIATVITLNRQEKGRKSGTKSSFFQKFLKRGNKETASSEGQGKTTSLSIEPILNTTSPAALGQSSLEAVTKGSLPVGGDPLGNSPSPSKTSLNRPPLLPVASPSKKTQPTNGVSEAGDSSGNSSVSSSDDCGKISEKATLAQPLFDKDDCTSGEFPRVPSSKPSVSVSNDDVMTEVVTATHPTRESLTAARDKLKSCSSPSRIPDAAKPSEEKMSFADSLRDALALKMSERDAAGTEAGLDASPTAGDAAEQLNCLLNSGKCKGQKDAPKSSKAPRKMMAPPPMAPPPPPPPSNSTKDQDAPGRNSSPKHAGYTDGDNPPRSLSPSFHGSSTLAGRRTKPGDSVRGPAPGFPLSNTLPRKSASSSSANSTGLNSTEIKVSAVGSVGLRQFDSAAKHARNKTVSEGVRFKKLLIAPQEEGEERNRSEDAQIESETLDRRASKFLNRALPAPPPKESSPEPGPDEIDNLYELVAQSTDPARDKICRDEEQLNYEDIDLCCAKANGTGSKASSTSSSTSVQATKRGTGVSDPSPSSGLYLEPVGGKEESGRGAKDDWRPCPAPRGSKPGTEPMGVMPYVNTRMINGQLPLNASDGFDAMAGLIANMLYHLTDRLYAGYVTRLLRNRTDVVWTDFELLDWTPRIEQEAVTFYQAKHLVLAPSGCILTVARDRQGPSFSLEPTHANVVSPLLCFAMTSSDLDSLNGGSTLDGGSSRNATAAVLLCSDVAPLDGFWEREHARALDQSTALAFEQSVCLCLVQILNALLYLRDSGCTVLRVTSDDVIMASSNDARWRPLVKPSAMTFDVCSDLDSAFLGEDIAQLLSLMLRTDLGKSSEAKGGPARTKYSRGLQRVLRTLAVPRTWEGLETGRNLLEFVLWGPSEEEAKLVAMTDKRDTSFRVWLEVARCRMASELVLEPDRNSLELADQARFLCRVTENSLLGVTKLLFE